jgi:enoyl-CoA hydratase/carnithine racemase
MDVGWPQKIPDFVGEGTTNYLIMTGRSIAVQRANELGLAEEVHSSDAFKNALADLASVLAVKLTYVHDLSKRHPRRGGGEQPLGDRSGRGRGHKLGQVRGFLLRL